MCILDTTICRKNKMKNVKGYYKMRMISVCLIGCDYWWSTLYKVNTPGCTTCSCVINREIRSNFNRSFSLVYTLKYLICDWFHTMADHVFSIIFLKEAWHRCIEYKIYWNIILNCIRQILLELFFELFSMDVTKSLCIWIMVT